MKKILIMIILILGVACESSPTGKNKEKQNALQFLKDRGVSILPYNNNKINVNSFFQFRKQKGLSNKHFKSDDESKILYSINDEPFKPLFADDFGEAVYFKELKKNGFHEVGIHSLSFKQDGDTVDVLLETDSIQEPSLYHIEVTYKSRLNDTLPGVTQEDVDWYNNWMTEVVSQLRVIETDEYAWEIDTINVLNIKHEFDLPRGSRLTVVPINRIKDDPRSEKPDHIYPFYEVEKNNYIYVELIVDGVSHELELGGKYVGALTRSGNTIIIELNMLTIWNDLIPEK